MREPYEEGGKAAAQKLQEAAHGGPPVAIPGGIDAGPTPTLEPTPSAHPTATPAGTPVPMETDADAADHKLEGGGRV